jgi:hypothetical protein
MYNRGRRGTASSFSSGRKVQFADGGAGLSAAVTSFKLKKNEAPLKGSKKLVPLQHSPANLPLPPQPSQSLIEDVNLPPVVQERRASILKSPPEKRFSVSMSKEKKAELLASLKEQRILNERKPSIESDDFVDNLSKQKINLQLRSVTERITEVYHSM